jgi:hypothetical protein
MRDESLRLGVVELLGEMEGLNRAVQAGGPEEKLDG